MRVAKFARLADDDGLDDAGTKEGLDTDKNATAAMEWTEVHGVLGLTLLESDGFPGADTQGGEVETVAGFAYEAWVANGCLRLYEAAVSAKPDVGLIASYINKPHDRLLYTQTPALARKWALEAVATETLRKVSGNVYPTLYGEVGKFRSGWGFTNLLGAMWLQMHWHLASSGTPRQCKNPECAKVVAFEARRNKEFCSKKCRERHHYLTAVQPRREAAKRNRRQKP